MVGRSRPVSSRCQLIQEKERHLTFDKRPKNREEKRREGGGENIEVKRKENSRRQKTLQLAVYFCSLCGLQELLQLRADVDSMNATCMQT